MDPLTTVVLSFPIFLFSLVFHECAHALAGDRLGDPTARHLGRLTLNPVPHIDPIGTVVFPLVGLLGGGFFFGWARPVPFSPRFLRHPLRDAALIAAAGPASNALLALLFAAALKPIALALQGSDSVLLEGVARMLVIGVQWNVMLCYFNLLPIPPLDGSKVAAFFLPGPLREKMWAAQAFGVLPLLLIFLVPGVARVLLAPASQLVQALTGFALS